MRYATRFPSEKASLIQESTRKQIEDNTKPYRLELAGNDESLLHADSNRSIDLTESTLRNDSLARHQSLVSGFIILLLLFGFLSEKHDFEQINGFERFSTRTEYVRPIFKTNQGHRRRAFFDASFRSNFFRKSIDYARA